MINGEIGRAKVFYDGIELKGVTSFGPILKKENIFERLINKIKLKRIMRPITVKFKIENRMSLNDLEAWDRIKAKVYKNKSFKNYKKLNMKIEVLKDFIEHNGVIEKGEI